MSAVKLEYTDKSAVKYSKEFWLESNIKQEKWHLRATQIVLFTPE